MVAIMPDCVGELRADAEAKVLSLDPNVQIKVSTTPGKPVDTVAEQTPEAGAPIGNIVTFVVFG